MRFVFESASEIKAEDEYRSGLSVVFTPWLGPKRMQPISIDLVVDEIPLEEAEVVTPAVVTTTISRPASSSTSTAGTSGITFEYGQSMNAVLFNQGGVKVEL